MGPAETLRRIAEKETSVIPQHVPQVYYNSLSFKNAVFAINQTELNLMSNFVVINFA